jgi:hypothetical protein
MRADFKLAGRRSGSLSHNFFVFSVVQVLVEWPLSPCTATMLEKV